MRCVKILLGKSICLLAGAAAAILGIYLSKTLSGPPLRPWHVWKSSAEFHYQAKTISDFSDYLQLEDDLFRDLNTFRLSIKAARISRYSPHNPFVYPIDGFDWNRTVELKTEEHSGAVLLLHGMSDSPYSLRSLAYAFQQQGFHVLVLRLPGHGTVPASLTRFTWREMAKAVTLAARHLQPFLTQERPSFFIVGYSNGAALALDYTLRALADDQLPRPAGMVLISPALAVTSAARFSKLIIGASYLPGLQKLAWLSRQPEYDPYKYNSFAVNAGYQVYLLAAEVQKRLKSLQTDDLKKFPPVLAIQSVVDTTVSSRAVVDLLMASLHSGKDELILFDVNRDADIVTLFAKQDHNGLESLMKGTVNYDLTLITNCSHESPEICARHRPLGQGNTTSSPLALHWPEGIYSLSHVALPIPPDDPVYGMGSDDKPTLGRVELRGEQRLLRVPADQLMRLRYNPFYAYMKHRMLEFVLKNANAANHHH